MSLPEKIKMVQTFQTERGEETKEVELLLETGEDYAGYIPQLGEGEAGRSFGPTFRGPDALEQLEAYFDEHKDEVA